MQSSGWFAGNCGNCAFPHKFHTKRFGKITVFYAASSNICLKLNIFLWQKVTNMLTVTASKPSKHKGYNRFFSKADASRSRSKERLELLIGQGSFTWYIRNIILKTNITYPTSYLLTLRVRIRGVRNITFSENFTFVLSNSKLPKNMQKIITFMVQLPNKKNEK